MNATARVRVNGFDFDSLAPVQGNVIDERYEQTKKEFMHSLIMYIIAIDLVVLAAWTGQWWYFGGYKWAILLFYKFASKFMHMVVVGSL